MMILHAATSGNKTIRFLQTMPRIFETAIYPSDILMCTGCSSLASQFFNAGDTRAFRWTTPPFGNFELISGSSTLEGWTADMDVPDQPISVNVYINGPVGVGTLFASFTASAPRPDLMAAFGTQEITASCRHFHRAHTARCYMHTASIRRATATARASSAPRLPLTAWAVDGEGGNARRPSSSEPESLGSTCGRPAGTIRASHPGMPS